MSLISGNYIRDINCKLSGSTEENQFSAVPRRDHWGAQDAAATGSPSRFQAAGNPDDVALPPDNRAVRGDLVGQVAAAATICRSCAL